MFDQIRIVISHWPMLPRLVLRSLLPSWPPATRKLSSLSSSSLGTRDLRLRRPGELGTWASEVRARSGPAPGPLNEPPRPRRAVRGVLSGVWVMLSSSVRGEYCENNAKKLMKKMSAIASQILTFVRNCMIKIIQIIILISTEYSLLPRSPWRPRCSGTTGCPDSSWTSASPWGNIVARKRDYSTFITP